MGLTEMKKGVNRVCLAVVIFILLLTSLQSGVTFLSEGVGKLIFANDDGVEMAESLLLTVSYVVCYLVTILIFRAAYRSFYIPMSVEGHMNVHHIPLVFSALGVCILASHFVNYFRFWDGGDMEVYHGESIVLLMLSTVLVPAFCEELFFRGLIMTNLMPFGRNFAIISSAVIFGLVHGNHDQILFATISGLALGWLYAETGNLWCGVIVHMLNNFISVVEMILWSNLKTGTAIKLAGVIEVFILVIAVISLVYSIGFVTREKKRQASSGLFAHTSKKLLDGGNRFTFKEYVKGFFSPAMIIFLCYVLLSEILYVFLY